MSDPTDVENLARRFLDLWQEQVTAAAGDPATADMVQRFAEAAAAAPAAWLALWNQAATTQAAARPQHGDAHAASDPNARAAAARAAPAGAASDDRGRDLAELGERLARLERRVAELEAAAGRRRAPRRGTGKRKP